MEAFPRRPGYAKRYLALRIFIARPMEERKKVRFRFSIQTLLLFLTLIAALVACGQWYSRYLKFKNSRPIEAAISEFNQRKSEQYDLIVGDGQPPLTSEQVINFLNSDHEVVTGAPLPVRSIFHQIASTERIPNSVQFDFISSSTDRQITAWLVGMEIMDHNARYRVNIRKIDVDDP